MHTFYASRKSIGIREKKLNKNLVLKPSVLAVALAIGASQAAFAQETVKPTATVYITGSNIKRIDGETASPVTVLRREDIKATGANTVRQVLDTLTSFDTTSLSDNGGRTGFASGATGAATRGLGMGATLLLVNGRRISNYALADGGQTTFVNLDAIPADVIDRIEVLRDGASALYGSDAMAGVINVITRNTYEGVRVSGSSERNESHHYGGQDTAGLVGGLGNLERDGYNIFADLELYQRKQVMQSEVMGFYPAWYKKYVSPAYGDPVLTSYPGNLNEAAANGNKAVREAIKGCPTINSAGLCTSDLTGISQVTDPAKRLTFFSQGRLKINNDLRAFAEVSYSRTQTTYLPLPYANAAGSPTTWFDGFAKKSQSVAKPKLPVGNPANPYSFPVGIDYRFMDNLGMWSNPSKSNQYRVMAGLEGSLANGWEWQAAAGRLSADTRVTDRGAHRDAMPAAVESGEYKIGGQNSQALLDRMFPQVETNGKTSQDFVDAKLTGELMSLPAGPLSFAIGGDFRRESMAVKSSDDILYAKIIGRGSLWIDGKRNLSALYTELNAPVTKQLELNGALRVDAASGFKSHVSPKLGAKFVATPQLMFRGTLAGGFRTPNIPETLGKVGLTGFFNSTLDPKRCDTATKIRDILKNGTSTDKTDATTAYNSGCLTSVPAMISSSKDLTPETSRSLTLGFVFEPVKNTSFTLDYFKIERKDEIAYRDIDYVMARESDPAYAKLMVRNAVSDQDRRLAARANELQPGANLAFAVGTMQSLLLGYENFGKTQSSGIDFDTTTRFNMGSYGTLNLGLTNTLSLSRRTWDVDSGTYRPNTVGLRNTPRLVSVFTGSWKKGALTSTMRVTRTSATMLNNSEADEASWGEAGCVARIKPVGDDLQCFRRADVRTDLNFVYSGFKNTRVTLNIRNALLASAPVNLRDGYSLRPRSFKLAGEYQF